MKIRVTVKKTDFSKKTVFNIDKCGMILQLIPIVRMIDLSENDKFSIDTEFEKHRLFSNDTEYCVNDNFCRKTYLLHLI